MKEVVPPPNGVFGWGASMIAIPGVYICPFTICCAANPWARNDSANILDANNIIMKDTI